MSGEYIFGYGSLVNAATHTYAPALPATLSGWRREWQHTNLRDLAFLSVTPDPDASIKGVILNVPHGDVALENRERHYQRHRVSEQISPSRNRQGSIHVFAIPPAAQGAPGTNASLLLSYIDVVVQGYYRLSGEAGVRDFFATTRGWGAPVINDRAAPRYPRHQALDAVETALTDHWLNQLAAKVE